jgi:hypothetical protein
MGCCVSSIENIDNEVLLASDVSELVRFLTILTHNTDKTSFFLHHILNGAMKSVFFATQYIKVCVAHNHDNVIVACRCETILTDNVFTYLRRESRKICTSVLPYLLHLSKHMQFTFTGHGAGAITAQLLALDYTTCDSRVRIITFGAYNPTFRNTDFCETLRLRVPRSYGFVTHHQKVTADLFVIVLRKNKKYIFQRQQKPTTRSLYISDGLPTYSNLLSRGPRYFAVR